MPFIFHNTKVAVNIWKTKLGQRSLCAEEQKSFISRSSSSFKPTAEKQEEHELTQNNHSCLMFAKELLLSEHSSGTLEQKKCCIFQKPSSLFVALLNPTQISLESFSDASAHGLKTVSEVSLKNYIQTAASSCVIKKMLTRPQHQRGITQNQDKGLSQNFPVILADFSPDSVAQKQEHKLPWRF